MARVRPDWSTAVGIYRNGVTPKPRCGKPLKVKASNVPGRVRDYDLGLADPVCGLPRGHERYENCKSEESVEYWRQWRRRRDQDRRAAG